jgi:F-type H+-transporting ATPase subunit epsilon
LRDAHHIQETSDLVHVTILNPKETLYEGRVKSVSFPGESGDFEVQEFHKPTISMLRKGDVVLDMRRAIGVERGIVRVQDDKVIALVEQQ